MFLLIFFSWPKKQLKKWGCNDSWKSKGSKSFILIELTGWCDVLPLKKPKKNMHRQFTDLFIVNAMFTLRGVSLMTEKPDRKSICSCMHIRVLSDWIPNYIKAEQTVLYISKMPIYIKTAQLIIYIFKMPIYTKAPQPAL